MCHSDIIATKFRRVVVLAIHACASRTNYMNDVFPHPSTRAHCQWTMAGASGYDCTCSGVRADGAEAEGGGRGGGETEAEGGG
jgi:hypothetical protein